MNTVLYNVPHDIPFHPVFMTMWFFLLSMSAASFLVAFMGLHGVKKFDRYVTSGSLTALALIGIAPLFILMQLGQPLRAYELVLNFNPTSPLSWGVVVVSSYFTLITAFVWQLLYRKDHAKAKRWGIGTAIFAVGLFLYSGSVLMVIESRPLWHTSLMPVLFAASGFVSAVALLLLVEVLGEFSHKFAALAHNPDGQGGLLAKVRESFAGAPSPLGNVLVQDILLDALLLVVFIAMLAAGSQAARETVSLLVQGEMSGVFLGVQLMLGMAVPLGLLVFLKRTKVVLLAASVLALVGIYAMRYVFIIGGLTLPLS